MKSDFFIDRPIFSTVISIVIVLVGLIGLFLLPVDQYPEIVPPVVQVSASYPGADAETVSQAVATPIEQELNGTPGMLYMDSRSTNTGSVPPVCSTWTPRAPTPVLLPSRSHLT